MSVRHLIGRCSATALTLLSVGCAPSVEPADLVLTNGKIATVDGDLGEVEALAVTGYQITAVGTSAEIAAYVGPETEVIDLEGRLATPGFIEGHGHFMGLGSSLLNLDLMDASSWDDIVLMVAEAVAETEPGTWINGRGWHQEKWDEVPTPNVDGVPLHASLDAVSPDNPVRLGHASGHAAFVNGLALELSGIDASTPDPSGGEIVHDASGNPTGLLRETAQRLLASGTANVERTPEQIEAQRRRVARLAAQEALKYGVTSFQDAGSSFGTIDFFKGLEEEGELPVRLYVMVRRESNEEMDRRLPDYLMTSEGDDYLTVRSIKRQIDGALGPHGAWLLEPYLDLPESTGLNLEPIDDIRGTAEIAIKHGFQVNTHAIGDRGNREVLDIYEEVLKANPDKTDLRWRIEHAQHLHPDDLPRFKELGLVASMQGIHGTSDGPWVLKRLGPERAESGAYMWRALIDLGVVISNGTDVPVERISPIQSYWASVSRVTVDGNVFYPAQRMTRTEALESYTINGAYAAFEEDVKGSLTPGKYADIVVLSKDILTIPEEEIPTTEVLYTIVGGEVRYRR